jgi:hypothetical protein
MVSTRVLRRSQNRRSSEAGLSSATAAEFMRRDTLLGATASLGWIWGQGGTEWDRDRDRGKSFLSRVGSQRSKLSGRRVRRTRSVC